MHFMLCSDISHLGRFDAHMLTEQQMLELFFTPINEEDARADLRGDADDGCTWTGVTCTDSGSITKIEWCSWDVHLKGSIDFQRMPPHAKFINFYDVELTGEIDTTGLPDSLEEICLQDCAFSGTIDLGSLPRGMTAFEVYNNNVTVIQNVRNLPEKLMHLIIHEEHIVD